MHFQKSVTWYTLTNIISIDEIPNEGNKDDVNIIKYKKWEFPNELHCGIC